MWRFQHCTPLLFGKIRGFEQFTACGKPTSPRWKRHAKSKLTTSLVDFALGTKTASTQTVNFRHRSMLKRAADRGGVLLKRRLVQTLFNACLPGVWHVWSVRQSKICAARGKGDVYSQPLWCARRGAAQACASLLLCQDLSILADLYITKMIIARCRTFSD